MKHIHRFFVNEPLDAGRKVCLDADDAFHAAKVLRLKAGDAVELADSGGAVFGAELLRVDGGADAAVETVVSGELQPAGGEAPGVALAVVQALPAGRKMDLIVEKLSEIGVGSLIPVFTEKSVARGREGRMQKSERWRRIARAAASQSRRSRVMEISEPVSLSEWLVSSSGGPVLALVTEVESRPLGEAVSKLKPDGDLTLVAGPEAGFSDAEIDLMSGRGVTFVSLGPMVLRTETAALVAAAVVMHRLGRLG